MDLAQPNTEGFRPGLLLEGAALKDRISPARLGMPEGEHAENNDGDQLMPQTWGDMAHQGTWVSIYRQPRAAGPQDRPLCGRDARRGDGAGGDSLVCALADIRVGPRPDTIWEAVCLTEVGQALAVLTTAYKRKGEYDTTPRRLLLLVVLLGGCTLMLDESTAPEVRQVIVADLAGRHLQPGATRAPHAWGRTLLAYDPQQHTFTAQVKTRDRAACRCAAGRRRARR